MEKKLLRDPYNRILGGVSSGLAHFWGLDTSLIRVAWVGLTEPENQPKPSRLGSVAKGCGIQNAIDMGTFSIEQFFNIQ